MVEYRINMTVTFRAPLGKVWRALATPEGVAEWMGSEITLQPQIGGVVSLFEGSIYGRVTAFEPHRRLGYTWREQDWEEGVEDSQVAFNLSSDGQRTRVRLVHRNLPDEDSMRDHREGWRIYFFDPMRQVLEG